MNSTASNKSGRMERSAAFKRIVVGCSCLLVVVISFVYAPWASSGPVLCPFRLLVGMPCPGCGLTRSFCAVSQGQIFQAFKYHLFGPLLFAVCVVAVPLVFIEAAARRRWEWIHRGLFSRRLSYLAAWSWMLYHGARLLHMIFSGQVKPALQESALGKTVCFFLSCLGIGCS